MTEILLNNSTSCDVTLVPNAFIEAYMPQANGEFVKVYLYLLKMLSQNPASFTLADGADALDCTERDLLRALRYWEKAGLVKLSHSADKKLSGICLLPLSEGGQKPAKAAECISVAPNVQETPASTEAAFAASKGEETAPLTEIPDGAVTRDKLKKLQGQEEFAQLIFLAETYLGRPLTATDVSKLAYFYEEKKMPAELIEFLLEYCVSGGHSSIRYIEKVGLSWLEKGIYTVEQARSEAALFNRDYHTIFKALGIKNHTPTKPEITLMDTWMKTWGFSLELILEACSRTILQTGSPSLAYAGKILEDWQKKGVRSLTDIEALDARHSSKKAAARNQSRTAAAPINRFNSFKQRDYDYDELEKQLLKR